MHLNFDADYPLVLHRIVQGMGDDPGIIAGDANHQVEGQIGACLVLPFYRKNNAFLSNK